MLAATSFKPYVLEAMPLVIEAIQVGGEKSNVIQVKLASSMLTGDGK
jgi:hypothetical protein